MIKNSIDRDKLWTKDYVLICCANFLLSFAFYLLIPTLPFYLIETMHASKTMVGIVLSCYTIAVLAIRPFSGFIADTFPRKPIYLIAYILFTLVFIGYFLAGNLAAFITLRIIHGLTFGMLSTSGNTLVIDIMPASRRGEGLGYYGVMGNIAMATGPMTGLILYETADFNWIFTASIIAGITGLIFASIIRAPKKIPQKKQPVSLDRFILVKGLPAALMFMMVAIPYAMTSSYIALSVKEVNFTGNSGAFFSVMAAGMILSRLISGKRVDRGFITQNIAIGLIICLVGFTGEIFVRDVIQWNAIAGNILFYAIAACIGYGCGTVFPALNTFFINLAPNNRRATANSTYLTGWDVGIGIGVYLGGYISEMKGFSFTYFTGTLLAALALLLYFTVVIPHFNKNRLR